MKSDPSRVSLVTPTLTKIKAKVTKKKPSMISNLYWNQIN